MVAGIPGASSIVAWNNFIKDPEGQLDKFRNQPEIKKKIDDFKQAWNDLANEKDPIDALFKDQKTSYVLLTAFQLEGDIKYAARNEKIVSEDITDQNSLIYRLIDGRYRDMAKTINYAARGKAVFSSTRTIDDIVNKFVINEFEKTMGDSNPGMREAAYFARNARNVTDVYQLLGDPVLRSVTVGGLQLPQQIGLLDVDKQAQLLEKRIDIKKLSQRDGTDLNTLLEQADNAQKQLDALQPAYNMALNGFNAVDNLTTRLKAVQDSFDAVDARVDPFGSNAAQVAFQQGQIGNYLQADGLMAGAELAIGDIDSSLARLKTLYQSTVGLNPVADAQQIADNKQEYSDLVSKIQAVINGATYIDPSSATQRSLLLSIPGPGVTTVSYQASTTSAVQNINGYNLQSFITDLQSAASDFNAGNYNNAQTTVYTTQSGYFTAKNGIQTARTNYENTVGKISQFSVTLDQTNLDRGNYSLSNSVTRLDNVLSLTDQLKDLATLLSNPALTAANRTTYSTSFFSLQASLNSNITNSAAGTDNLLTTNTGFTYNIATGVDLHARSADFTAAAYNGVRTAPAGPDVTTTDATNFLAALSSSNLVNNASTLRAQLSGDQSAFDSALNDFDPYADAKTQLAKLSNDLASIKSGADANSGKNNALKRGKAPLTVQLPNNTQYTVNVFENYDVDVENLIKNAASGYATNPATARTNLDTAQRNLVDYRNDTSAQLRPIQHDYREYQDEITTAKTLAGDDSSSTSPYDGTNQFVLQFIQRYLVLNQQSQQSASSAYELQLLPKTGGGLNLSSLI